MKNLLKSTEIYERKSRLSRHRQMRLLEHFVAGTTARAAGEIVGVQANTAINFYMRLRCLIASKLPNYELSGEIEADESYFGGVRKGKRGRGAAGKVAVFGLLKRGRKVYTAIIPNITRRIEKFPYDRKIGKLRHKIENTFAKLKRFRRINTRYDKLPKTFMGFVTLAAITLWVNLYFVRTA